MGTMNSLIISLLTDEEVESQLRMRLKIVAGEYD